MGATKRTTKQNGLRAGRGAAYRVWWSDEDREWIATVEDLPSLSWLAPTPTAALAGLLRVERQARKDQSLAAPVLERIRSGNERVFTLEEVERDLGLAPTGRRRVRRPSGHHSK